MQPRTSEVTGAVAVLAAAVSARAAAASPAEGLSVRYPGDTGIGADPAVLFTDDFEGGDMKKWDTVHQTEDLQSKRF